MDLTAEIRIKVELLALSDMTPARQLAIIRISNDFELLYSGQVTRSLSRNQIRKMILRFRNDTYGWICSSRFDFFDSMFGYSKYFHRLHIYIVPKGFSQCLVIMVYYPVTRLYIPVFFILLQGKKYEVFFKANGAAIGQCYFRLQGRSVTLDFEQGLIKAVIEQFPSASKVLCLFHWKQGFRRKLLSFHIPKCMISLLMEPEGLINILPVVEIVDIPKAVAYIRSKFDEGIYRVQFDNFWRYFLNTWCVKYDPTDWNICELLKGDNVGKVFVGGQFFLILLKLKKIIIELTTGLSALTDTGKN